MKIERLFDILQHQKQQHPLKTALAAKINGQWIRHSTDDLIAEANAISLGLLALGVAPGDKIANISNNRPEWNFLDFGMLQIGAVHVPIYPTITDEDYNYILNHAEVKYIFVSSQELYDRIIKIAEQVPSVKGVYTFDKVQGAKHWTEVKQAGEGGDLAKVEAIKAGIKTDDLFTIIYTSGTTGFPKGVMLSHGNVASNVEASDKRLPCTPGDSSLSFLPLCHIYERMLTYLMMYRSISIHYAESMETIGDNLKEVKPQVFSAVPRLLEKVYDKIVAKGHELTGIKKGLFFWALNLGLRYELNGKNGWWYETQLKLANKIIFSKWREALGGNVKAIASGAAALQPRLARVFWSARIPVLEGYGLTETSPVISVNYLETMQVEFGSVGPVIEGVQVKLAADGEILCKGPNVMMGYYKRPELTEEVIDSEGWFHTGDIGTFTAEGNLKITDRKKEIFKTSGGKYIAPQVMENKFKESLLIEQIMVCGEGRNFPSALISPAWDNVKYWCEHHNIKFTSQEEIVKHPQLIEKFQHEIDHYNAGFGQWEKIKKFSILPVSWGVDTGELTATMKLKRKVILEKFKDAYENMYRE
ncbi:MAG: AMP-dependent synthetase/ligase [Bacteroidia bacterium]